MNEILIALIGIVVGTGLAILGWKFRVCWVHPKAKGHDFFDPNDKWNKE